MDAVSQEAGPEWAYLAPLTSSPRFLFEFDSLYIKVQRQDEEAATKICDSIQILRSNQGIYVPSDVTRFDYDKLREFIGADSVDFDLYFEAYEGAGSEVAISDASSFRRLLLAIGHLGLAAPESATASTDFPPVLRFLARPKDALEALPVIPQSPRKDWRENTGRRRQFARQSSGTPSSGTPERPENTQPHDNSTRRENTPSQQHTTRDDDAPEDTSARHEITPSQQQDISMGYEDTPPFIEDVAARLQSSTLESPQESTRTSFLAPAPEPQPLTFDERVQEDLDFGLTGTSDLNDVHMVEFHNFYADIAGIDRGMTDPENPNHAYKPPYSTISLFPYQSYFTAYILGQGNKLLYYLADKPGLGKTYTATESLLKTMLILSLEKAIEQERVQLPSLRDRPLHMHDEEHPRWGKNDFCRANTVSNFGVVCPCILDSPTNKIIRTRSFSPGYMLVVVPLALVSQWVENIKRFIRSDVRLPHNQKAINVINIHEGENYGENLKKLINGNPENFGLGTIVVVPTTSTVSPSLEDLRKNPQGQLLKTQPSLICIDEVHSIGSTTHSTVEWIRRLIHQSRFPVHVLALSGSPWKYGPSDFDVIESIALDEQSISAWWGQEAYNQYQHRLKSARANLNESAKQVTRLDIVGRGQRGNVRDEDKTDAHEILKRHDQALREYAAQIPLLQRKERSIYLGYFIPGSKKTEIETIIFDSGMNDAQKLVANDYKEFLRVSHRKEVQTWSRKPESTRGPRPKIKSRLFRLDAGSNHNSRIEVSLVGFAPGMAQHILEKTKDMQFRSAEANKIFGKTTTASQRQTVRTSPYWGLAQTAFYKVNPKTGDKVLNPKVDFIDRTIEKMLNDHEPHVKDGKVLGVFPKKMIIVVPHPFQGMILTAYLFWRWPNHTFSFVGAGNETDKNRPALLAPFQRSTTRKHPEDGRQGDPIALISTYNIIGVGLNLTRCNYLISTSPLASKASQDQQFGRIDRQGQYATVHGWVLADHGNPVDVTTFYRMQKRTALTVSSEEIGSGLNFLLDDIDQEDARQPDADDAMDDAN